MNMPTSKTDDRSTAADRGEARPNLGAHLNGVRQATTTLLSELKDSIDGQQQSPPAQGFQTPSEESGSDSESDVSRDIKGLLTALSGLGDLLPQQLRQQFTEALKEFLLALQALIEWALNYLQRPENPSSSIEEIPIV